MPSHYVATLEKVQTLIDRMVREKGYNYTRIADEMGGVSARSIYRWARGEHIPQRPSDVVALETLAERVLAS
jgi:transposase-like protein